jgi:hypothetical protein
MAAPRKRAAKKQAPKSVQVPKAEEPQEEWTHRWPKEVVEKHQQRQEAAQQLIALQVEQKKQRLINNGVPPEKRSI